ncbi:DUF559 domain-containing protein [Tessaracoccus sp. SD287]|uniref:endonuclease domain-containing protein n=1 Tax=Tessaracoccus sp. SD287 TaxID=2782008 RepID=UPI001A97C7E2|nr:DUF559 domain-containing protein [Tessaracoccus sp. SD287]MBO1031075.1 DUF559 domain-containing protein [Tessaracoccus sp. SD287]
MTPATHLIVRAQVPLDRRGHVDEQVRRGNLRAILPGIYTAAESDTWLDRVHAAQAARPQATVIGAAAARLLFWPALANETVPIAPARFRNPPPWLVPTLDSIPTVLTVNRGDLRIASPALAALQLVDAMGASPIDEVLRSRAATIRQLTDALDALPNRAGNRHRARLLWESRDSPWSALERRAHSTLRQAGIKGWRANHRVRILGRTFYIDAAFPGAKLALEFDGWAYHSSQAAMESDAERHNYLQLDGWTVLRFTWHSLDTMPDLVIRTLRKLSATCTQ